MSFLLSLFVPVALAQPAALTPPSACDFETGGFGAAGSMFDCASSYVSMLTYTVIAFSASLCLVMLIVNGFRYMVGPAVPGGSSDAAKKGIGTALTGLALALLTYVILDTLVFTVTQ